MLLKQRVIYTEVFIREIQIHEKSKMLIYMFKYFLMKFLRWFLFLQEFLKNSFKQFITFLYKYSSHIHSSFKTSVSLKKSLWNSDEISEFRMTEAYVHIEQFHFIPAIPSFLL